MLSIEHNMIFKSLEYTNQGTSCALNVIEKNSKQQINLVLKTASGFGGGNAALILKKSV
jgi:3-oxoacyl-[acyl-carrier-protein] synthase-1